ncbi:MAG: class I SAM-dependent methyltransferase [Planctomycetota bacterium]
MLKRVAEPKAADPLLEAEQYHAMDHSSANEVFVRDFLDWIGEPKLDPEAPTGVLDLGCGPGDILRRLAEALLGDDPNRPAARRGLRMVGIDASPDAISLASDDLALSTVDEIIHLDVHDVTDLEPWDDGFADWVLSNTVVHHVDDPKAMICEAHRLAASGGRVFIRDLARPADEALVETLVERYSSQEAPEAQQLFRQSLHAAYRVDEVQAWVDDCLPADINAEIGMTSDRHWTLRIHKIQ